MARNEPDMIAENGEIDSSSVEQQIEPLLRTKLFAPSTFSNTITRPRLLDRLNTSLEKALILVAAPAGYGKTTLVSNWLKETGILSAWLSLDENDNDPVLFLQYFITALHTIFPSLQLDLLSALHGKEAAPFAASLNLVINEISERSTPFVLVLDDFHAIHAQTVLDVLAYLLEHMPPSMHVVLISRSDPQLSLSRYRARNQLVEIRANQLRFTQEEIALFLNEVMGLKLPAGDIQALEARTEGWIAGLQLAAISLQASQDVHGFVSAFTGSHYYIMDYLTEEVLRVQPERVRSFLLQTSILDRLCGPLCHDVCLTDQAVSGDGQAMLEALGQMNLFIIPLDNERRWYRYHQLFADVLNRRLEQLYPHQLPDLHRRASAWYEQNGFISDAIRHALMAGDKDHAAQLVDQNGCLLLIRGEVINLLSWIEAVEPHSQTFPWIAIQKAWALCLTGQLDRAEEPLQTADRLLSTLEKTDDVRTMLGAVTAARAHRANLQGEARQAVDFAREALDCLPVSSDLSCSLRGVATSILGDASWMDGNLAEAQRAYSDAVQISQSADNIHMIIIANSNLADILLEQGKLQRAARIFSGALQMAHLPDGKISPLAERVYAGLSKIYYEWNRLADSAEYVRQCIDLSRFWGNYESQAIGYVVLAGLEHVQCKSEDAREAMRLAEQLISEHPLTPWQSNSLKSDLARLWIALGNLERASHLIQDSGIEIAGALIIGEITYLQEPIYIVLLRLYLARGEHDAALALAGKVLQNLHEANRLGRLIEILVLQALAYQGKKDIDQALVALEKALILAQPEGFVRTFLDEGEPMVKLLVQAKAHRVGMSIVPELLSALGSTSAAVLPPAQQLIEPLTSRELEVLQLIENGCSNQDIAGQLFISIPTVKRHISNIYAKLGVKSRTQAVSLGRELNLF
jgi:LuxR family maltose regulon positive regulatory protein